MVARLKLKGIDGRAPPGVNILLAAGNLLQKAARKGEVVSKLMLVQVHHGMAWATLSNCGKLLKL